MSPVWSSIRTQAHKRASRKAYDSSPARAAPKILLTTYFGALGDNLALAASLPVDGLHVDLVRAPEQLEAVLDALQPRRCCRWAWSMAATSGARIWTRTGAREVAQARIGGERLQIAPSCWLLHVPIDLALESSSCRDLHAGWRSRGRSWKSWRAGRCRSTAW